MLHQHEDEPPVERAFAVQSVIFGWQASIVHDTVSQPHKLMNWR